MVEVNEKLTRHVADLARLELSEQEIRLFTTQLGEVLNYIEILGTVDVHGVEPLTHPFETLATPMREDEAIPFPTDSQGRPKVLESSPEAQPDGYKVPPIL